jgi:undecaprenyl-diphosphatase
MDAMRHGLRDPLLWLAVAFGAGFVSLAIVVGGGATLAFEATAIHLVTGLGVPVEVWEALTFLGGSILILLGVLLVVALLAMRRVRLAVAVAVALLLATFATEHIKEFVARLRPPGDPLAPADGYSFPSGHTLESTVTYGLIALAAWRSRLPRAVRRAAVVVAIVLPLLIGLSRIALGVHFPSDVVAGWLGGVAVVIAVAVVARTPGFDPVERPAPE